AGAMENRAATLDGAISNLGDAWDNLFLSMSQDGSGALIETGVRGISDALKVAAENSDILTRAALVGATSWTTYYIATKLVAKGNTKLVKSFSLVGAALVGLEIGSYLSDEFSVVRQAGIAMAAGLSKVWEELKYRLGVAAEGFKTLWNVAIDAVALSFSGWVMIAAEGISKIPGMGDKAKDMTDFAASLSSGVDHAAALLKKTAELRAERDKNNKQNNDFYSKTFADAADKPKASNVIKADFGSNPPDKPSLTETDAQKEATDNIINLAQAKFDRLANIEATATMAEEDRVNQKYERKLEALQGERDTLQANHAWTLEQKALFADAEKAIEEQKKADLNVIHKRGLDKYEKLSLASAKVQATTSIGL
ncbi:MAG: hypothetical protein R8M45_09705, partial [Ghiorsea sp.]